MKDTEWTKDLPTESGSYWWWRGDPDGAPIHIEIMYSGATGTCFAPMGQYGWTRAQDVSEMGGWWMPLPPPDLPGPERKPRPKIICLVGSSRFADVAAVQSWEFSKQGIITLSYELLPQWYWEATGKVGNGHAAEQEGVAPILDELHLRKIDMADEVFVINSGGYIGERTRFEIEYAKGLGKPVKYMNALASCAVCGGDCSTQHWMCDHDELDKVYCPACFLKTPCAKGEHGEGCPTFVCEIEGGLTSATKGEL